MASTQAQGQQSTRERLRNLEILKYGHAVRIDYADEPHLVPDGTTAARLAEDTILTGLCQLVAWRLKCANVFVCLNDLARQHIIAEATRTVSPYDASVHAPDDGLMFGVRSFDQAYGITFVTMPIYTQGRQNFVSNRYTSINDQRSIFLDLKMESLVDKVPFLQGEAAPRFYLEVPLKNDAGIVVGIVGAIDREPRSNFDEIDTRPMVDGAKMVMDHIELVRLRDLNAHAERLLQGLGHFNVGASSITHWVQDNPTQAIASDLLDNVHQGDGSQSGGKVTESMQPWREKDLTLDTSASTNRPRRPSGKHSTSPTADKPRTGQAISDVHRAFARAANLIREAMDLESTCFLQIPSDSHFSFDNRERRRKVARNYDDSGESFTPAQISDRIPGASSESDRKGSSSSNATLSTSDDSSDPTLCRQIAFSTKTASSLAGDGQNDIQGTIPQRTLGALVSMFPKGHIFQFDAFGPVSSGDDSEHSQTSTGHRSRRRNLAKVLSSSFPRARSLLFVPLYNNEQGKLYSAFFGWIAEPTRVMVEDDCVYVGGFANSIMSEIMRLEMVALEKTKSVFMASISHELRSPLHGILGATELLRELDLTVDQSELVLMVDSCGKSLLDIMNNLLEHAKINNMIRQQKRKRPLSRFKAGLIPVNDPHNGVDAATPVVSLAEIVEETVIGIVSGHSIKTERTERMTLRDRAPADADYTAESQQINKNKTLTIVLNIQKSNKLNIRTDAGIWRRIVMNLLGNALKYTSSGYVVVGLNVVESTRSHQKPNQITFTVSDTGRGISEGYMKNRLYTPFAQEDHLSIGVGLGLSIVDRLVAELHGKISIDSKVDVGTNVRVLTPLPPIAQSESDLSPSDSFIAAARQAGVDRELVYFCGFDILPVSDSVHEEVTRAAAIARVSGLSQLKHSLEATVKEWFGVTVTLDSSMATIFIVEANHAYTLLKQDPTNVTFSKKYIVVHAYGQGEHVDVSWPGSYSAVSTPIGPRKLSRVLTPMFLQGKGRQHIERPERAASHSRDTISAELASPSDLAHDIRSTVPSVPSPVPSAEGSALRVLLVDDNDINLRILAGLVRKLKIEYKTASNGQEGLDQYVAAYQEDNPFQYVFMDISMPVMDGLTATRRIRKHENEVRRHEPAKIFALTGLGHIDTQEEASASGVDQYFRKPVRLDVLRRAIHRPEPE